MNRTKIVTLFLFTAFAGVIINLGCNSFNADDGKNTAQKYCGSCHLYPEPDLLPKHIWEENVLPAMGVFANFFRDKDGNYHPMTGEMIASKDTIVKDITIKIPEKDWNEITAFYLNNAPKKLAETETKIDKSLKIFDVEAPAAAAKPFTCAIFANKVHQQLITGNMLSDSLKIFDSRLRHIKSIDAPKGTVDLKPVLPEAKIPFADILVTNIGNMQPSPGEKKGFVELLGFQKGSIIRQKIADSLDRPVQSVLADVNNDGLQDLAVCQFGFLQGALSLFLNNGKYYKKKTLSTLPGAIKILADDIDKNGMVDFWVLFAAAYEGIVQFINKGNGNFEQRVVLSFPPTYGSTSFEIVDFNNDGKKDILYTCGDNADYSQVLKPYHGIYLYENSGPNSFKKVNFFAVNGCYKATMADYDLDGDLDIASISFFADYEKRPEEGFILLKNEGNSKYTPLTFPQVSLGRWICMESSDFDGDGDTDIILGNLAAMPSGNRGLHQQWMAGPEFVVLRNKSK